jgi:hypothetical protein
MSEQNRQTGLLLRGQEVQTLNWTETGWWVLVPLVTPSSLHRVTHSGYSSSLPIHPKNGALILTSEP